MEGYVVWDGCEEVCFRMALDQGVKLLRYVGRASACKCSSKGVVSRWQWYSTIVVAELLMGA